MKKFLLPALALMSLNSFAGNEKGNGGGMHYCPAKANQEVYDVYEGKKRYQLEIIDTANSVSENNVLSNAIKKLAKHNQRFARAIEEQIEFMKDERNFRLDPDIQLTPVPDANILMVDRGCAYEQLANWDDISNSVFVRADLFEKMTSFNKAALKLHEAVYKASRIRVDVKNSDKVRRFVAELLSTSSTLTNLGDFGTRSDIGTTTRDLGISYYVPLDPNNNSGTAVGTLNLGKMDISNLESVGTMKFTIREWRQEFERSEVLKAKIANLRASGNNREARKLEKELSKMRNLYNFGFLAISNDKNVSQSEVDKSRKFSVKSEAKGGMISMYASLSTDYTQTVTLDIEFTDSNGKIIQSSLPLHLKAGKRVYEYFEAKVQIDLILAVSKE